MCCGEGPYPSPTAPGPIVGLFKIDILLGINCLRLRGLTPEGGECVKTVEGLWLHNLVSALNATELFTLK